MDVNQTLPVQPLGHGGGQGGGGGATGKKQQENPDQEQRHGHTDPAINVSGLLSIDGLTPEAQHALQRMAAEIDPLRRQVEQARVALEEARVEAYRHGVVPGLNRHGFVHELEKLIHRLGTTEARPALILVHLVNGDEIRRKQGLGAHNDALRLAHQIVSADSQQALLTSVIGGNDFAMVVLEDGLEGARRKAEAVVGQLRATYTASEQFLQARTGTALLEPGMTAEAAIAAADRDFL
ncbi:MAG: GGDEF domain-containing protein [Rhodospirillaceae bacterium]